MYLHIVITALLCSLVVLSGCKEPEPLRIGFVGELSNRAAGLGVSGRDGFLLAIEQANAKGGINGRSIEGLIEDTTQSEAQGLRAIHTLVEKKVSAIIGPMTSQMAVALVPEVNAAQVPMISPTVSTNQLTGLDDYFFRVYYTNAQAAELLAKNLSAHGLRRIAVIFDLGNRAYTEDWLQRFQLSLENNPGASVARIPFELHSDTLLLDLATQTNQTNADGVLILANAVDTAMICQKLAKLGSNVPRYATGWSYADDLIQFGGKSVEGLTIIQSANLTDPATAMQQFIKAYQTRFRITPNFPAVHAYDATRMVLKILEKTTEPEAIRAELLQRDSFKGLQSDLAVDRYGDLKNPQLQLARINQGRYVSLD